MMWPFVTDLAAEGFPVARTCRVLKLSRASYYRWLACPVSDWEWREAHVANALFDAHQGDPEFGYRLLADEISDEHQVSARIVWRICSQNAWWSVFGKKPYRGSRRPGPAAHEDLVRRRFFADAPNQIWLTDITEHPTGTGKLYLCAVRDMFAGRIVGYSMAGRMQSQLAVDAINMAVARRGDTAGCTVHSDRGSQFRSKKFLATLQGHGLVGSMGQVASAGDNAAMESFFALLQKNVLNRRRWETREQLRTAIITWIEGTYHRRRRQIRLGKLTPIEYETIMNPAALAA